MSALTVRVRRDSTLVTKRSMNTEGTTKGASTSAHVCASITEVRARLKIAHTSNNNTLNAPHDEASKNHRPNTTLRVANQRLANEMPPTIVNATNLHNISHRSQNMKGPMQTVIDDCVQTSMPRETIPVYGATMCEKGPNTFRVAAQNPNGFRALSVAEGAECEDIMKELDLDIYGLSETNRNWDERSKYILMQIMRRDGPGIATAASDYSEKEGYLPGGTILPMKGFQRGCNVCRFSDRMGHFCYMLLNSKDGTVVPFLVLYRVCQKRGTTTTPNTSYMREVNHLCLQGHKYPDPRAQTLKYIDNLLYN